MLTIKLTNTSAGLIAIQRALAGEDITFTKLDIGDGVLTNLDISNFTGVINKIKDSPLGVVKPEGQEMVRLRANINNVGITEDKAIREFGLYAKFGSSEQEFLFAYMNTGDIPTALPSSSGGRYDLNRDFVLYIGSSTNVTFDSNGDLVYSTLNDYKALEAQKEDKFSKNTAFNKDFGVAQNQVLEGSKLAEILGIEYGGVLNNNNQKVAGKGYYDTANKKIYKCTTNTSINYADAGYFIEVSNNDLLGKLQNLYNSVTEFYADSTDGNIYIAGVYNTIFKTMILRIGSRNGNFTTTTEAKIYTFNKHIPQFQGTDFCINDGGSTAGNIGVKAGFINISYIDSNNIRLSTASAAIATPIYLRGTVTLQLV